MVQEIKAKGDPAAAWESLTFIHDPVLRVKHVQGVPTNRKSLFSACGITFWGHGAGVAPWHSCQGGW